MYAKPRDYSVEQQEELVTVPRHVSTTITKLKQSQTCDRRLSPRLSTNWSEHPPALHGERPVAVRHSVAKCGEFLMSPGQFGELGIFDKSFQLYRH